MISMQGRSADFTRHALPSIQKQRILVTLVKSQSRKTVGGEPHRFLPPSATWAPPPSRTPVPVRPAPAKHFGPLPSTGVLPPPTPHQQLPQPNGMYVTTPVAAGIAYPAPVPLPPTSAAWPAAAPPRHPQPRLPVPGTGVFLPSQGPVNSSNHPPSTENINTDDSAGKPNGPPRSPPKGDEEAMDNECNGSGDKVNGMEVVLKEGEEDESSEVAISGGGAV